MKGFGFYVMGAVLQNCFEVVFSVAPLKMKHVRHRAGSSTEGWNMARP